MEGLRTPQGVRWLLVLLVCALGSSFGFAAQNVAPAAVSDAAILVQMQQLNAQIQTLNATQTLAAARLKSHDDYLFQISQNAVVINANLVQLNTANALLAANIQKVSDSVEVVIFLLNATATVLGILWGCFSWRLVILAKNQRDIW